MPDEIAYTSVQNEIENSFEEKEWDEEKVDEMITMRNGEVVTKKEYENIRDTISNLNK